MGAGKIRIQWALDHLQADQFARQAERSPPVADEAIEAKLPRVGAAVDLAVEQNVAGFDAQAVGRLEAAFAHAFVAPGVEDGLPQTLALRPRRQQLIAELTAVPEARYLHGIHLDETEVAQRTRELRIDQAPEDARARRSLQRGDGIFARAVARDAAQALRVAAPAGEEPPAIGIEPPCGGVVEDAAIVVQEKRVGDLAGLEVLEVAALHAQHAGKLVVPHEGEVEQACRAPGGDVLFASAHSERQSNRPPLMTHSAPARRRRASALAMCARRTPMMRPASSKTVTRAAMRRSINPWRKLPSEPEVAAMICSTWLVATAVSGT